MSNNSRIQRILALAFVNWFARGYLAVCCALLIWTWVDSTFVEHPDASLFAVVPLLVTAPLSMVVVALPGPSALLYAAVIVGALVNATLIGWCTRTLRQRGAARR
ncbi:SCO4225 family membrane protein [Streptomyces sp. bgisy100]|uniref:SCO4225 family membrane protein n=1 Tax=Streptomyces sp. bgisy100 TaxID=3413783 RepID=UPI003D74DF7E